MALFRRRPKLPADRRPALDRDERVLAWSAVADSEAVVVVTNRGLWLPAQPARLGWHEIHKAVWSGTELAVTPAHVVAERDGYRVVADRPVQSYRLREPGEVPHHVRARVTSSVAYSLHHPFAGGGVRVVGRRVSGVDGLSWTVRYDPATDHDSDEAREVAAALVAQARGTADPSL
ncbi:hypothetical protein [Micromonospora pattaloongensis]|uniref:hypothetical protein n=1 Tax=Micromonospora pattaloongensis TaxID=405436 RepID=UPI001FE1C4B3|nr:hypothetical protein [Micromonospora pattaloongensis]